MALLLNFKMTNNMLTFQQRRDTILSQFAQAKADLETLNSDIDAEIERINLLFLH